MSADSLVAALPFLAYCAALLLTWKVSAFKADRKLRGRVVGLEAEMHVLEDQVMRFMKRQAAAASVESREEKRERGAAPPWQDPRVDPEARRSALRQAFAARDAAVGSITKVG